MTDETTNAEARERYDDIAHDLAATHGDVELRKLFSMPAIYVKGKACAGFTQGTAMVFKLTGAAHAEALGLEGAHLFDPGGMDRPMKEWVVVPATHAAEWPRLAELALAYVSGR
ncbi:MAG TPA: hypothetical protein VHR15_09340 [Ktedonobacterales bacterium]|jgi:hypothetical protein|nr:hypothetical protein [Ktedonobacterales bacterium]